MGYTVAICKAAHQGLGSGASELASSEMRALSQVSLGNEKMIEAQMATH